MDLVQSYQLEVCKGRTAHLTHRLRLSWGKQSENLFQCVSFANEIWFLLVMISAQSWAIASHSWLSTGFNITCCFFELQEIKSFTQVNAPTTILQNVAFQKGLAFPCRFPFGALLETQWLDCCFLLLLYQVIQIFHFLYSKVFSNLRMASLISATVIANR